MIKKFQDLGEGVHRNLETGRIVIEKDQEYKDEEALRPRVIGTIYPNLK